MPDVRVSVLRCRVDAIDQLGRANQIVVVSYWVTAAAALAAAATVLVCTDRQRKLLGALGVQS